MRTYLPWFLAPLLAMAQQAPPPASGARELYYLSVGEKDKLPPVRRTAAAVKTSTMGAVHLGLRYNLLLIRGKNAEAIPADRVLRKGDCFAIEFSSNRSGYLYVLAKQSSGTWMPLLPSPEMKDETNVIDPGRKVRVPAGYCFAIEDPPGTENLFVVLSRDPRDFYELYEGIKGKSTPKPAVPAPAPVPQHRKEQQMEIADGRMVNQAVKDLEDRFGSRDIVIKKVAEAPNKTEPQDAVYVVNASAKPASSIVTEIAVRHR